MTGVTSHRPVTGRDRSAELGRKVLVPTIACKKREPDAGGVRQAPYEACSGSVEDRIAHDLAVDRQLGDEGLEKLTPC